LNGIENVIAGNYDDMVKGNMEANVLKGGLGRDILDGGAGAYTADYSDKTTAVKVTLNKSTNATVYVIDSAEDTIKNIENINGGTGSDQLTGDSLANTLNGNAGNDFLTGGLGADSLYGGADKVKDVFIFKTITESMVGMARDKVYEFIKGIDVIDFNTIDANTKVSANQAFNFANTKATANSVWYQSKEVDGSSKTSDIIVYGDVNGDAKADFEIGLVGVASIAATDFVL